MKEAVKVKRAKSKTSRPMTDRAPLRAVLLTITGAALLTLASSCGITEGDSGALVDLRVADREQIAEATAGALFQGAAMHEILLVARPVVPPVIPPGTVGDVSYIAAVCDTIPWNNKLAKKISEVRVIDGGLVYSGRETEGTVTIAACPLNRWRTETPEFLTSGEYTLQATVDYALEGTQARFDADAILFQRPQLVIDPDRVFVMPEPPGCGGNDDVNPCVENGPLPLESRRKTFSNRQPGSIVCDDFDDAAEQCRVESTFVDTRGDETTAVGFVVTGEQATGYELSGRVEGVFGGVDVESVDTLGFECPFDCERCQRASAGEPPTPPGCSFECTEDLDNNDPNNDERPNKGTVTLSGADGSTGSVTFLDCNTYEVCVDIGGSDDCTTVSY